MKKIYLSGFDVFYQEAVQRGEILKKLCEKFGFVGIFPLDGEVKSVSAKDIFICNIELIDEADIVVANLNPFRGNLPDDGTAFEIGYAFAKNKDIFGYISDGRTLREKFGEIDSNGFSVEDFGSPVNLMLSQSAKIFVGDFENCLKEISKNIN
ncbi:MAG: nucleoside 2-deoxyribosyltransferase [Oscillospiraceae bacterium]